MDQAPSPGPNGRSHESSARSRPSPERAVGLARVWTAVGILLLVCLHSPSAYFPSKQTVLCASAFALYSLVFFSLNRGNRKWTKRTQLWLHGGDVVWAVTFSLLTREPRLVMLAFLFVLTAAAQRWSPNRVLETSAAIALLVSAGLLVEYALPGANPGIAFHPSNASYIFWGVFALFAGGLIWFLARRDASQRWEAAANAAQRAHSRVSVELHDSIVQSLFTVECYIERILSKTDDLSPVASEDLISLQDLVRKTSVKLRDIIWQERSLDLGSQSFVEYVTALVAEFEQETGIAVRFSWDCGKISPPPAGAGELVRIIQEALLNIRKHSGARNVTISCGVTRNSLQFYIDDDGQGFDFSGRLGMVELESTAQGPFVIRERVSALGGELAVESKPGRGARLEIALPKDAFV
jgi:signal transduction histidine kinase